MKKQICSFVNEHNLLSSVQSGYRPGFSTKTAMLKVIDDIGVIIDEGNSVVMILLDYSKAFDTISHAKLCQKLKSKFYFNENSANMIKSYLSCRQQAVFHNNCYSSFLPILSGVPQGSVLGPILFSLYINDLPLILKYCTVHLFADDVQLYFNCAGLSMQQIESMLNEELRNIEAWSVDNSLKLNASKTNALMITSTNHRSAIITPNIQLGANLIQFVDHATSLGITIESRFTWEKYLSQQCGKIYGTLRYMYPWAHYFNRDTKLRLFKAMIYPYFLSMDFLLPGASAVMLDRIRVALNSCVRFVYNLNRYSSVTYLQRNLIGCSFYNFPKARACRIIHNLIKTKKPDYLYNKLKPFQSARVRKFILPRYRNAQYGRSFFVRGIVYWNELPQYISLTDSTIAFKERCLEYF